MREREHWRSCGSISACLDSKIKIQNWWKFYWFTK